MRQRQCFCLYVLNVLKHEQIQQQVRHGPNRTYDICQRHALQKTLQELDNSDGPFHFLFLVYLNDLDEYKFPGQSLHPELYLLVVARASKARSRNSEQTTQDFQSAAATASLLTDFSWPVTRLLPPIAYPVRSKQRTPKTLEPKYSHRSAQRSDALLTQFLQSEYV